MRGKLGSRRGPSRVCARVCAPRGAGGSPTGAGGAPGSGRGGAAARRSAPRLAGPAGPGQRLPRAGSGPARAAAAALRASGAMAAGRRGWDGAREDDLPVYLARPGTADQVPRQKYGGMFCNVEGAFESKTLDFDALSVGQRGARTPRSGQGGGRGPASGAGPDADPPRRGRGREEGGEPAPAPPAPAGVEIRSAAGKEVLQNLGPRDEVRGPEPCPPPSFPSQPGQPWPRKLSPAHFAGDRGPGRGKGHPPQRVARPPARTRIRAVPQLQRLSARGTGDARVPLLPAAPPGPEIWVGVSAQPASKA